MLLKFFSQKKLFHSAFLRQIKIQDTVFSPYISQNRRWKQKIIATYNWYLQNSSGKNGCIIYQLCL